jgi:hypothetical protein
MVSHLFYKEGVKDGVEAWGNVAQGLKPGAFFVSFRRG